MLSRFAPAINYTNVDVQNVFGWPFGFVLGLFFFLNYNNLSWWIQLRSPALSLCVWEIIGAKGSCELSVLGRNLIAICILGMQNFPWVSERGYVPECFLPGGQSRGRLQAEKPAVCDYVHKVLCLRHSSQRSDNSLQLCFWVPGCRKASHLASLCLKFFVSILQSLLVSLVILFLFPLNMILSGHFF